MKRFTITPTAEKNCFLEVKNFAEYTEKAVNLTVDKAIVGRGYGIKTYGRLDLTPLKIYNALGKPVYYLADKKLYTFDGYALNPLTGLRFANPPQVFTMPYRGKNATVAILDGEGIIVGNGTAFLNFIKGKDYLVHNGVLCCFEGDKIIFGGAYDYAVNTVNVSKSGFIGVQNLGEIVKLVTDGEKITAFCQKGLCNLYVDGDRQNYRVEYPKIEVLGVCAQSVKTVGVTHFFATQSGLYSLSNSLKKLQLSVDLEKYEINGEAFIANGVYYLPVTDGENYLLAYDINGGQNYLVEANDKILCDGGFTADKVSRAVGVLDETAHPVCRWQSRFTDLNADGEKTVYKICIKSSGSLALSVESEHGRREIITKGGSETIRLNIRGTEFKFAVSGGISQFPLEKLNIYYRR